jgi:hypothetical protein
MRNYKEIETEFYELEKYQLVELLTEIQQIIDLALKK